MSNLEVKAFSNTITHFVDSYDLPDEVKRMALQEILTKQEQKALNALVAEVEERDAAEAEKQKEVKQDADRV